MTLNQNALLAALRHGDEYHQLAADEIERLLVLVRQLEDDATRDAEAIADAYYAPDKLAVRFALKERIDARTIKFEPPEVAE